jgi:predicted nucleic acid-binding Zn ribbon protein
VRRLAPRGLDAALARVARDATPATSLARVQECWLGVAGPVVAAESWPTAERAGVVTVSCSSAVWAQELELLATDMAARLKTALGEGDGGPIQRLRFEARGFVHG